MSIAYAFWDPFSMEMSEGFNLRRDKVRFEIIGRINLQQKYGCVLNESLGEATVRFPRHVVLHRVEDNCDAL